MRVLLTGGTGFVGINIAEALAARGDEVVLFAPDRLPEAAAAALSSAGAAWSFVEGDVRDAAALRAAATRCEAVVHGAAITPGGARERAAAARAVEINTLGTVNALEAAREAGVDRFLHLSSASVYGAAASRAMLLDEVATPARPETVYAVTKFAAERLALRYAALARLDVRCVRIGAVFGPWERDTGVRDTLSPIHQATRAALAGAQVVLPRAGRRDWVYARDVAAAVLAMLDADPPPAGVVNIGSGVEWSVADWCGLLARRLPRFRYAMARTPEEATIDLHGPADRPPLAIDRLAREIGFRPRFGLAAAFDDYLAWLAGQGEVPA